MQDNLNIEATQLPPSDAKNQADSLGYLGQNVAINIKPLNTDLNLCLKVPLRKLILVGN